eukprot:3197088-Pleurochrysis_carterae.AAC.2
MRYRPCATHPSTRPATSGTATSWSLPPTAMSIASTSTPRARSSPASVDGALPSPANTIRARAVVGSASRRPSSARVSTSSPPATPGRGVVVPPVRASARPSSCRSLGVPCAVASMSSRAGPRSPSSAAPRPLRSSRGAAAISAPSPPPRSGRASSARGRRAKAPNVPGPPMGAPSAARRVA